MSARSFGSLYSDIGMTHEDHPPLQGVALLTTFSFEQHEDVYLLVTED